MQRKKRTQQEDEEPVVYCTKCYSLKIKYEDSIGIECCGDCGCTDFKTANFEEWEKLYKERYGHKYMEEKGDIRKSPIFQMSIDQLKDKVYSYPQWRTLCKTLCPDITNWLGKADTIILMFAKLYKENRLDDLRMELTKLYKFKK